MAENQAQPPQRKNEPVTDPPKPGYGAFGDDAPVAPVYDDEPVTDPTIKPGYDAEGE